MRVSFNELAERELNDAAAYYEREQAGLGGAFIAAVEQCVDAIVAHPMAGVATTRDIRRRLFATARLSQAVRMTDGGIAWLTGFFTTNSAWATQRWTVLIARRRSNSLFISSAICTSRFTRWR